MEQQQQQHPNQYSIDAINKAIDGLIGSGLVTTAARDAVVNTVINMLQTCIDSIQQCGNCVCAGGGNNTGQYYISSQLVCKDCAIELADPQQTGEIPTCYGPCQGKCGKMEQLAVWAPQMDNPDFGATEDLLVCSNCRS